jgi:hypothetical protein
MSFLVRQPHPTQQVCIAGVGANVVELRVKFDCIDVIASSKGFLQSCECSVLVAEHCVAYSSAVVVTFGFGVFGILPEVTCITRLLENLSKFAGTRLATF